MDWNKVVFCMMIAAVCTWFFDDRIQWRLYKKERSRRDV